MNWRRKGSQVRVVRPFGNERPVRLYGEVVRPPPAPMRRLVVGAGRGFQRGRTPHRQPIIQNLVITEPCVPSIAAIEKIKHRLNSRSTICLLQPGLGVVERLNELYFPHPETRPRYILAHMTHKLGYTSRAFTTAELEQGKMMLTVYPPPELPQAYVSSASPEKRLQTTPAANERVLSMYRELSSPPAADEIAMPKGKQWKVKAAMANNGLYLMYLLGVAPTLGTGFYRWGSFMKEKVPDMIYTSASETVTTVLDLPLGDDISLNGYAYGLLQELVTEMIDVVRAMPETHADPSFLKYVESGQLKRDIMKQLHQFDGSSRGPSSLRRIGEYEGGLRTTTSTIDSLRNRGLGPIVSRGPSTMSVRTSLGRRSDVQFLTGYFVRRGRELGVACPKNEMMIRMVQARRLANKNRRKRDDHIGISDEAVASSDVRQATRYFSEQGALRKNAEDEGREPPMAYASAAGKFGRIDTAQSKRAVEEHDEIREVEKDEQVKEDEEIEEDEEDEEDTEDTEAAEDAADIQDPNFDGKPQPTG
ncbi:hypothetical protein SCUCBS95973_003559 [Sporothrix curviconia]|uniref:Ketopantoate reductase C-terminal domain-containing protein n=1 Tax=Sporothrix curviconia TaxID=1260050 RepID=A0ABP0BGG5_9PEZI